MTLPNAYPGALAVDLPTPGSPAVQTGRRWTDGKMIWVKAIDLGTLPNATTANTAHGETIDTLVELYGRATAPTDLYIPLPFADPSIADQVRMERDGANIVITAGNDRSAWTGTAYMEFTI